MNWNPLIWISKKYVQEIISIEISPIKQLIDKIEKENIGLNYLVINHKERIEKLEDRLRECEIKIVSYNTAMEVLMKLSAKNNGNQKLIDNE